jgi:hypothetical protein
MADDVKVLPDTNEARTADPEVPNFGTNYVETGLHLLADFDAGLLSVSAGAALHSFNGDLYYATNINRRTGQRRLSIPSGTTGVYYDFEARSLVMGDPGEPALQIGSVDASGETVDETINRTRDVAIGDAEVDRVTGGDGDFNSVNTGDATIGNADTVSGGPIGDTDEIVPFDPIPVTAEGATFSTNSTSYVRASPVVAGYVVFDTPPTNTTLKMRFAGDVDVNPADIRFGLGDQNGNFGGSYGGGGATASAEVAGYTGRSPQPTDWFDVDDNTRGQPLVKVKQPDGNDVFVRSMMVQFGYEVNG